MEAKSKRGGARLGAGRKPTGIKRVVFQVSLQPSELEYIEQRSKELNLTKSAYILSLVNKDK